MFTGQIHASNIERKCVGFYTCPVRIRLEFLSGLGALMRTKRPFNWTSEIKLARTYLWDMRRSFPAIGQLLNWVNERKNRTETTPEEKSPELESYCPDFIFQFRAWHMSLESAIFTYLHTRPVNWFCCQFNRSIDPEMWRTWTSVKRR